MLAKQKFPKVSQFYCWKGHKNLWKIVADFSWIYARKTKVSKSFPILLLEKPQKSLENCGNLSWIYARKTKVSQFYCWKSLKNHWKIVVKLVEFMVEKQKFPMFPNWENHKNLWKVVAELVEFVLEKKAFQSFSNFIV